MNDFLDKELFVNLIKKQVRKQPLTSIG